MTGRVSGKQFHLARDCRTQGQQSSVPFVFCVEPWALGCRGRMPGFISWLRSQFLIPANIQPGISNLRAQTGSSLTPIQEIWMECQTPGVEVLVVLDGN